jgi:hypothetical protein
MDRKVRSNISCRTSLTTPTTVISSEFGPSKTIVLPIGLWFGQSRFAMLRSPPRRAASQCRRGRRMSGPAVCSSSAYENSQDSRPATWRLEVRPHSSRCAPLHVPLSPRRNAVGQTTDDRRGLASREPLEPRNHLGGKCSGLGGFRVANRGQIDVHRQQ